MRTLTTPALLLDVFDLHDRDRIVTFLTPSLGKRRGVAPGARRKYSRFAGRLQPLAKVSLSWFEKEGRELVRINEVELLRSPQVLQSSLEGILLGSYLAEQLAVFAQEGEANEPLFRLLDSTLAALEAGADHELCARYVEVWVLRLAGIFPPPGSCPLCGRALPPGEPAVLSLAHSAVVCADCGHGAEGGVAVSPAALALLRRCGRENLAQLTAEPPAAAALAEVEALAGRVRRAFLGHELKSYDVMRKTLGSVAPAAG